MPSTQGQSEPRSGKQWVVPGSVSRVATALPGIVMICSLVSLAWFCRSLLVEAAAGRTANVGGIGLWAAVGGFLFAAGAVVMVQSLRLVNRVAGPEYRMRRALQRIRDGDVGFRIALRRGDLLTGLARECNDLLEWLNKNPPPGVRTGSDIVEVAAIDTPRRGK